MQRNVENLPPGILNGPALMRPLSDYYSSPLQKTDPTTLSSSPMTFSLPFIPTNAPPTGSHVLSGGYHTNACSKTCPLLRQNLMPGQIFREELSGFLMISLASCEICYGWSMCGVENSVVIMFVLCILINECFLLIYQLMHKWVV